jgi:hypothetical protein
MLQAFSTRENIQTWGETKKCIKIGALPTFTSVPLDHLHYVHYAMCFQQEWGTCPDFFLFHKKNYYPPHPNNIF